MNALKHEQELELIDEITKSCNGSPHIFRGTPKVFEEISTSIWRKRKALFDENKFFNLSPADVEKDIVDRSKRFFGPGASIIKILTAIDRHRGDTNLISFSSDLLVALFHACNGSLDQPGQVIALPKETFYQPQDIDYEKRPFFTTIIHPASSPRASHNPETQCDVYAHVPDGFIPKHDCKFFNVPAAMKLKCREFLQERQHW